MILIFMTHLKSFKFNKKAVSTLYKIRQLSETVTCNFYEKHMQI